jgi:hypothetical protein
MSDLTQMKEELRQLDCLIQAERNDEVRHGLQRSRLEAERAQLLVRMIEAMQRPALAAPYAVTWQSAAILAKPVQSKLRPTVHKPDGLPTVGAMVLSVLDGAEAAGLKPQQIRERIREKYWPEAPTDRIISATWRLAKGGKIHQGNGRYWLNGYDPRNC